MGFLVGLDLGGGVVSVNARKERRARALGSSRDREVADGMLRLTR